MSIAALVIELKLDAYMWFAVLVIAVIVAFMVLAWLDPLRPR